MDPINIQHEYKKTPAILFPNGDIFLCVASIVEHGTRIVWAGPELVLETLKALVCDMRKQETENNSVLRHLANGVSFALGLKKDRVKWTLSSEFKYRKSTVDLVDEEIAVYNQDIDDLNALGNGLVKDRYLDTFLEQPFCAAVIVEKEIASICFHGGNGSISAATKERFRNNGYGSSCLRVLTKRSIESGIALTIATETENQGMNRIAELVGYEMNGKMYWLCLPSVHRAELPAVLEAELQNVRFDKAMEQESSAS